MSKEKVVKFIRALTGNRMLLEAAVNGHLGKVLFSSASLGESTD